MHLNWNCHFDFYENYYARQQIWWLPVKLEREGDTAIITSKIQWTSKFLFAKSILETSVDQVHESCFSCYCVVCWPSLHHQRYFQLTLNQIWIRSRHNGIELMSFSQCLEQIMCVCVCAIDFSNTKIINSFLSQICRKTQNQCGGQKQKHLNDYEKTKRWKNELNNQNCWIDVSSESRYSSQSTN